MSPGSVGGVLSVGLGPGKPRMVVPTVLSRSFSPSPLSVSLPTSLVPQQQDPGYGNPDLLGRKTEFPACAQMPPSRFSNSQAHQMLSWLKMQIPWLYPRDWDLTRGGAHGAQLSPSTQVPVRLEVWKPLFGETQM